MEQHEKRSEVIYVRVTPTEKKLCEEWANDEGVTLQLWARLLIRHRIGLRTPGSDR